MKRVHQWSDWVWCPKAETPEEERKRWGENGKDWVPVPRGKRQMKVCSHCGRGRTRTPKETS